jgi:hypothetical protein
MGSRGVFGFSLGIVSFSWVSSRTELARSLIPFVLLTLDDLLSMVLRADIVDPDDMAF